MKNLRSICIALFSLIFLFSCKKESIKENANLDATTTDIINMKVSPKGYLIFPSVQDLLKYDKALSSESKNLIVHNLALKGFKHRDLSNSLFARDQDSPYNYYFDTDGLMQIANVLIKISDDDKFLYIVKEQNLDPEVYV